MKKPHHAATIPWLWQLRHQCLNPPDDLRCFDGNPAISTQSRHIKTITMHNTYLHPVAVDCIFVLELDLEPLRNAESENGPYPIEMFAAVEEAEMALSGWEVSPENFFGFNLRTAKKKKDVHTARDGKVVIRCQRGNLYVGRLTLVERNLVRFEACDIITSGSTLGCGLKP